MLRTLPLYMKTVDVVSVLGAAFALLCTWQDRADQRRHLSGLDDRMLRDIGLSRLDVDREIRKPFWQA